MSTIVKCKECGKEYELEEEEDSSNYQCDCGGSLEILIKTRIPTVSKKKGAKVNLCKNCGNKLPENTKICPECGFEDPGVN